MRETEDTTVELLNWIGALYIRFLKANQNKRIELFREITRVSAAICDDEKVSFVVRQRIQANVEKYRKLLKT